MKRIVVHDAHNVQSGANAMMARLLLHAPGDNGGVEPTRCRQVVQDETQDLAVNVSALGYSHNLTNANARRPEPSFAPQSTGQNVPSSPVKAAAQSIAATPISPTQFSASMLLALLNAQPENRQPGGTSVTVSSEQVSLQRDDIDPAEAARRIIDFAGSGGELDLSDVERLLGTTKPEPGEFSPKAVIARDWNGLTGGRGALSASQLAAAIEGLSGAQLQPGGHGDRLRELGPIDPHARPWR